jgi:aspartyl-tRNA(Asn)/glutamyl-tRNA(Gln) amidotransferase subunit A
MSLDHIGPLAPDVGTAARLLAALAGPHRRDPSTRGTPTPDPTTGLDSAPDASDYRVGLVAEAQDGADDPVTAAVADAADRLAGAGATVEEVSLPGFDAQPPVNSAVTATEFTALVAQAGQDYGVGTGYSEAWWAAVAGADGDEFGENVRGRLVVGRALTDATQGAGYVAAQNARHELHAAVDARLAEYDALLLSTTPTTAPGFGEVTEDADLLRTIAHTAPFNLTGHPALSVPVEAGGEPVGCQLVTGWHDEVTAVALGRTVEAGG